MTAFISLRTQYENLGDEVINGLLAREMSLRMPVVAFAGDAPSWYLNNFRAFVGPTENFSVSERAAEFYARMVIDGLFKQSSWLFLSPGDASSTGGTSFRDRLMSLLSVLPRLRLASVGTSFSSLSEGRANVMRISLKHGGAITARDRRSQAKASALGISLPVIPDLALLLERRPSNSGSLALFSLRAPATKDAKRRLLESTAAAIETCKSANLIPVFSWQVTRDREYCLALAQELEVDFYDFALPRPDLEQAGKLYSQCRVVISNRLHVLLISAAYGSLPLPLLEPHEAKVRGAFEEAGLAQLIYDPLAPEASIDINLHDLSGLHAQVDAAFAKGREDLTRYFDSLIDRVSLADKF